MIVTPGGSGQIIKSHFLKEKFNEPIQKSLPLVFVERFLDLITISIIIFITLFIVGFLFESIIVDDVNIDDITIGDKNAIILATRVLGYGAEYPMNFYSSKLGNKLKQLYIYQR